MAVKNPFYLEVLGLKCNQVIRDKNNQFGYMMNDENSKLEEPPIFIGKDMYFFG